MIYTQNAGIKHTRAQQKNYKMYQDKEVHMNHYLILWREKKRTETKRLLINDSTRNYLCSINFVQILQFAAVIFTTIFHRTKLLFFSAPKTIKFRSIVRCYFFFQSWNKSSRYSFSIIELKSQNCAQEAKGLWFTHTCQSCATFSHSTLVVRRKHCLDDRHYHYLELKKVTSNGLSARAGERDREREKQRARILCVAQQTHVHLRIKMLSETIRFFLRFFIALIFVGRSLSVCEFGRSLIFLRH